ncbi:hypothetical protein GCM10009530_64100 [Microbispora corallina]|uniref:Uncharacterized protein n=1 Tax=Microbispora corallina TaxID=83302 RepID=A0ABQ4GCH4_9ACTN|nr:hypothetical protein Mco01_77880 [Microbispora corallina]
MCAPSVVPRAILRRPPTHEATATPTSARADVEEAEHMDERRNGLERQGSSPPLTCVFYSADVTVGRGRRLGDRRRRAQRPAALRVRHLGYHVAYCATVRELARHVDLADLVEVVTLPSRPA